MHIIEAIAIRDYCVWDLKRIFKSFPNTPIHKLIDEATGFDKERVRRIKELLESLLEALEITGDDKKSTQELLDKINNLGT